MFFFNNSNDWFQLLLKKLKVLLWATREIVLSVCVCVLRLIHPRVENKFSESESCRGRSETFKFSQTCYCIIFIVLKKGIMFPRSWNLARLEKRVNSPLDEEHMNAQEALLIMALTMGRNHSSCLDSVGTSVCEFINQSVRCAAAHLCPERREGEMNDASTHTHTQPLPVKMDTTQLFPSHLCLFVLFVLLTW